ncbi:MAG: Sir2 family NAD-dependent protein deacetylase, partial [Nakamurella sp.]
NRTELHERLTELNPDFGSGAAVTTAPDGDVDFEDTTAFRLAPCVGCGGPLKPHVVFFGENVPRERVDRAFAAVDQAEALLVAGSSLTVMSGLRFVRHAARAGTPIVIVNRGITRGDPLASCRVDAGCSQTLSTLVDRLC